jgi:AcrR family transcriptional regulator
MTETTTHDGDPETDATAELTETQEAIVEATYSAVCEYGYADVTMQDIADRTDRSKAALHYHFDCRADLFREFLSYLHAEFVASTRERDARRAAGGVVTDDPLDPRRARRRRECSVHDGVSGDEGTGPVQRGVA